MLATSLLLSACGAGAGSTVASTGTGSRATDGQEALEKRYTACLASHGYVMPTAEEGGIAVSGGDNSVMADAMEACKTLEPPATRKQMSEADFAVELKYAQCMRAAGHDVKDPDRNADTVVAAAIPVDDTAYQADDRKCSTEAGRK